MTTRCVLCGRSGVRARPRPLVLFEGRPGVVVPGSRGVIAGYFAAFCLTATLTALVSPHVPGPFLASPLAAGVGAVLLFELVRRAQWHTRTYVLLADRAELRLRWLGVLPPTCVGSLEMDGARLTVGPHGPLLVSERDHRLSFAGLDPTAWDDLAMATAAAGGRVDPDFAPRPASSAAPARGLPLRAVVPLLLVCVALGAVAESRVRRERAVVEWRVRRTERRARQEEALASAFESLVVTVRTAAIAAEAPAEVLLNENFRRTAHPMSMDKPPTHVVRDEVRVEEWDHLLQLGAYELPDHRDAYRRERHRVQVRILRPPTACMPAALRVEVAADGDPLTEIVLDQLCAQLEAAGVVYERVARMEPDMIPRFPRLERERTRDPP